MAFLILLMAIICLGLCLVDGKSKKGFMGVILAILYFPFGVIMTLTKKFK